jgi:hypothetical protein
MASNASVITSSIYSDSGVQKRDMSEMLRRLTPEQVKMLALVDGTKLDPYGKPSYTGSGMIKKRAVSRIDPECALSVPIDLQYLATGGSGTTAVIADTTGWSTGDTIVNMDTAEVAIVSTLTSGTTLTVVPVSGSTWSCSAGQWIAMMASAYEEGTGRYSTVSSEPTTFKTRLQTFREGISIAEHIKYTPEYINEKGPQRYKTDKTLMALRKLETSMFMSRKSTSGSTSVTIGGVAYPLSTMDGVFTYAGTAIDMQGGLTWESFNTILHPQMPLTLNSGETLYCFTSRRIQGTMNQWVQDSHLMTGANSSETRFGKAVKTYLMGGNLEVEVVPHERFEHGVLNDSMLYIQSSDLEYLHLKNNDINVRENCGLKATMGTTDIIEGIVGLVSKTNGANIKWVKNCLSVAA